MLFYETERSAMVLPADLYTDHAHYVKVRARAEIKNLLCEQRAGCRVLASSQPRPQGFSLKKWVWREKALASAGHVSPRTP